MIAKLKPACVYALANRGQTLSILVRYTELSPARLKNFWRE